MQLITDSLVSRPNTLRRMSLEAVHSNAIKVPYTTWRSTIHSQSQRSRASCPAITPKHRRTHPPKSKHLAFSTEHHSTHRPDDPDAQARNHQENPTIRPSKNPTAQTPSHPTTQATTHPTIQPPSTTPTTQHSHTDELKESDRQTTQPPNHSTVKVEFEQSQILAKTIQKSLWCETPFHPRTQTAKHPRTPTTKHTTTQPSTQRRRSGLAPRPDR